MDIRLNKTDSIHSRNVDVYGNLSIAQTGKILPINGISGVIDINDVFNDERDKCTDYRLTLTINPFCTNILFNQCTEIIKDEGTILQKPILDDNGHFESFINNAIGKDTNVSRADMVRNTEYSRNGMIANGNSAKFSFHPGMDIFNNHILRNKTSKIITFFNQALNNNIPNARECFNTIKDYVRDYDGKTICFEPRITLSCDDIGKKPKHQYLYDDIYSFIDGSSFLNNVYEENGWVGFKNTTTIDTKDGNREIIGINRVINDRENCEFIDLYPDRSLFLFTPKYNNERDRNEYNWDIEVTYPYKNFYNHPLIREIKTDSAWELETDSNGKYVFGDTFGLLMQYGKVSKDANGRIITMFRSYIKHKFNRGVYFNVFYKLPGNSNYIKYSDTLMVASIGDTERKNNEYFFATMDDGLYREMFCKNTIDLFYSLIQSPQNPNEYVEYTHVPEMIPDITNGSKISYYVYVIDSSPNPPEQYDDMSTFTEIPYETLYTPTKIKVYNENGIFYYAKEKVFYELNSNLVTDDDIIQYTLNTFNASRFRIKRVVSDIESEYYFRIFRKVPNFKFSQELLQDEYVDNSYIFENFITENASYEDSFNNPIMYKFDDEWYDLAFGKTIYGDQITQITYADLIDIDKLIDNLGRPLTSIYATIIKKNCGYKEWYDDEEYDKNIVEYSHCFGKVTSGVPFLSIKEDRTDDIRNAKSFLSDARSLRNTTIGYPYNIIFPLSLEFWIGKTDSIDGITDNEFFGDLVDFNPVNAYEITLENVNFRFNTAQRESENSINKIIMEYDELIYDDFEPHNTVSGYGCGKNNFCVFTETSANAIIHPEGYIYEPHYEIKVRELCDLHQDSHYKINIFSCEPIVTNGIFIKVVSSSMHKSNNGDVLYICNDKTSVWYKTNIVSVQDTKTFVMNVIQPESENYINWIDVVNGLSTGDLVLRRKNMTIPEYAKMVRPNNFVWRDINNVGNTKNTVLPEYPFTNGSFYIDKQINFFLKRQDPEGINKLYNHSTDELFNDIGGMTIKERVNDSIEEGEMVC